MHKRLYINTYMSCITYTLFIYITYIWHYIFIYLVALYMENIRCNMHIYSTCQTSMYHTYIYILSTLYTYQHIHYNTNYHTHIRIYIFYLQTASNKVCVFAQTYIQQQNKPNTDVANFTSHTITFKERVSDLYIQM